MTDIYSFKRASLAPKDGQRVLVTSDIHGHIDHLESLLKKANFGENDLLIVIGDLTEKGPNSLAVLRYVMKLCNDGRAISLIGNVDNRFLWQMEVAGYNSETAQDFLDYLKYMRKWKGTSLYDEMCREIADLPETVEDILTTMKAVKEHFKPELDFLRNLPTVLETPNYIFVHGGMRISEGEFLNSKDSDLDASKFLKFDDFITAVYDLELKFSRYIVTGHWPVVLYDDHKARVTPIFDSKAKVITIDGGCGLHHIGQLNMLVLPRLDCTPEEIETVAFDGYPKAVALSDQQGSHDSVNIRWGENEIVLLETKDDCAKLKHIRSQRCFWVPSDFIYPDIKTLDIGDHAYVSDVTDYILPITAGDGLTVVRETAKGILAKSGGYVGWYYGKVKYEG